MLASGATLAGIGLSSLRTFADDKTAPPKTLKFLFFDFRAFDLVEGFQRKLIQPVKFAANPLLVCDRPWEFGNITLYGSVVKRADGPFQLWYSVIKPPFNMMLAYAESDDGLQWRKPEFDTYLHDGKKTNIVFADNPHGPSIMYDALETREDWKYKMICGAAPEGHIRIYRSADGIKWTSAAPAPVIAVNPDCPMSLLRRVDGSYAAHHRVKGGGRRIGRSESRDFITWTGQKIVLEPDPEDPPRTQFYGMGATAYGDMEIGTLWNYHTDADLAGPGTMNGMYDAELTFSRNGSAWHRALRGQPFIPNGNAQAWDCGNLQCASAPLFLKDEMRFYYAASNLRHGVKWELQPGKFGVGMATTKPDRLIALSAGKDPAQLISTRFPLASTDMKINAAIANEGSVRVEILDAKGIPIPGFGLDQCVPLTGDSLAHTVEWRDKPDRSVLANKTLRFKLIASNADLYAVYFSNGVDGQRYDDFRSP